MNRSYKGKGGWIYPMPSGLYSVLNPKLSLQLFFHLGVQQRNARIALYGAGITLPESVGFARGRKQGASVDDQALDVARTRGRLLGSQRFVDLDQQRRDRAQPL